MNTVEKLEIAVRFKGLNLGVDIYEFTVLLEVWAKKAHSERNHFNWPLNAPYPTSPLKLKRLQLLNKSEIKVLSELKLNSPTFILGLSDQYGINEVVVQSLIEHTRSEKFAELYSPYFPDFVEMEDTGICHLPRYEVYGSEKFDPNTIIMTGEVEPDSEDTRAYYEVFSKVLDFAKELNCKRFLTFGCFQAEGVEEKIYVAATTGNLVSRVTKKLGGKPFVQGQIDGLIGMIPGLAKTQDLPAICILSVPNQDTYRLDTQNFFHYIIEALKLKWD